MSRSTDQFITQMKLTELSRQRERLRRSYREVAAAASAGESERDELSALLRGLADIRFANDPLHPAVSHLKLLPEAVEAGAIGPALQKLWLDRVREELQRGELRSEIVYLFGRCWKSGPGRRRPTPTNADKRLPRRNASSISFLSRASRRKQAWTRAAGGSIPGTRTPD